MKLFDRSFIKTLPEDIKSQLTKNNFQASKSQKTAKFQIAKDKNH